MAAVTLHVYDVTNSMNVRANSAILNLNKVMRDGIGVGGIFHGAVQVSLPVESTTACSRGLKCVVLQSGVKNHQGFIYQGPRFCIQNLPLHTYQLDASSLLQHAEKLLSEADSFAFMPTVSLGQCFANRPVY